GGRNHIGTHFNDVWTSTNGTSWTPVTTVAPMWSARRAMGATVFDGKMWVFGGISPPSSLLYNDVWWTSDGATWIQAQAAPWSARQAPRVAVLNNEMYLIGGNTGGDEVWLTTDGQNWTQQTSPAWDARQFHGIASPFDNKLWVFGGFDNTV